MTFLDSASDALARMFPYGAKPNPLEPGQRSPGDRAHSTPADRDKRRAKRKAAKAARRKNRR